MGTQTNRRIRTFFHNWIFSHTQTFFGIRIRNVYQNMWLIMNAKFIKSIFSAILEKKLFISTFSIKKYVQVDPQIYR
jgi:hypothetical protein